VFYFWVLTNLSSSSGAFGDTEGCGINDDGANVKEIF
jgi:hypothetical protein